MSIEDGKRLATWLKLFDLHDPFIRVLLSEAFAEYLADGGSQLAEDICAMLEGFVNGVDEILERVSASTNNGGGEKSC